MRSQRTKRNTKVQWNVLEITEDLNRSWLLHCRFLYFFLLMFFKPRCTHNGSNDEQRSGCRRTKSSRPPPVHFFSASDTNQREINSRVAYKKKGRKSSAALFMITFLALIFYVSINVLRRIGESIQERE